MPFTHIEIQKERQWKSVLLFIILIGYYFLSFVILGNAVWVYLYFRIRDPEFSSPWLGLNQVGVCLLVAFITAIVHWFYAVSNGVDRILLALRGQEPDPNDRYHKLFTDIVEEIQIATGGRKVRPVIVPTVAMNAFAIATSEKNATIGVTEGLLAKLTRPQLECVVGHEMAHILNNDCILVTIACSLFATFNQMLQMSLKSAENSRSGGLFLFSGVLAILTFGAKLLNMAIDRQREYLADATAVRLTRDPTSLAEALTKISNSWKGAGYMDDSMAPIFILSPSDNLIDQQESFYADLFSTHPPLRKRLDVLLQLAHTNLLSVEESVQSQQNMRDAVKTPADTDSPAEISWMVKGNTDWQGPYTLPQMQTLSFLNPNSWICRTGSKNVELAFQESSFNEIFRAQLDGNHLSSDSCPRCRQPLALRDYEGTQIRFCKFCQGYLVEEDNIFRILARREIAFSDDFKSKVQKLYNQEVVLMAKGIGPGAQDPSQALHCPKCNGVMSRTFYSYQYRIVVDRCYSCGLIWFDKDELEMLQVQVETSSVG